MQTESSRSHRITAIGAIASCWGIIGFYSLVIFAMIRLSVYTVEAFAQPFTLVQWLVLVVSLIFMAYSEGYKGFQKSYSPRFAARVHYLSSQANGLQLILAPLFCMGFFNAPKRRIISSVLLSSMIVTFVLLFKLVPQPWRGILDAGVVLGLIWGLITTALCCYQVFFTSKPIADPEVS
ncbi:MAG TPA: hypothetical protein DCW37_01090 [Cellvibrionales bacterium]|mgnify:FL=1|jgi:hypothetical protein|nr:hypothetical protein [Pseudomonadales bacterium]HAW13791.1 hypothetical protein [Cellvibrionales bacterium]HCX27395.1 hypothetical protein [Cellvibrionales bacterium]